MADKTKRTLTKTVGDLEMKMEFSFPTGQAIDHIIEQAKRLLDWAATSSKQFTLPLTPGAVVAFKDEITLRVDKPRKGATKANFGVSVGKGSTDDVQTLFRMMEAGKPVMITVQELPPEKKKAAKKDPKKEMGFGPPTKVVSHGPI